MKIFAIGLSRTGTTSLTEALKRLGYKTVHWPLNMREIVEAEAATDITVSCRFRELDRIFPGSKFIHTTRSLERWLESVTGHYSHVAGCLNKLPPDRKLFALEADIRIYGELSHENGQHVRTNFTGAMMRHHKAVADYFKDRPQDLLTMDIEAGDGWEKLCPFLGKPVPGMDFPHKNHDSADKVRVERHPTPLEDADAHVSPAVPGLSVASRY